MRDASLTSWVIEVTELDFEVDVLQRSQQVPVLVDFWAEWCGPCRQLGPALEKLAAEKKGAFVLAKVNVDEAQQLAGYFRIESIPAVLAFRGGQAVNGFVGLVADEQLREFIDELVTTVTKPDPLAEAEALEETEPATAEKVYREALATDAENQRARIGLARVLVAQDQDEEAGHTLEPLGESGEFGEQVTKLKRTLEMKRNAATAGDEAGLRKKIASDPENAQWRLELGNVLATKAKYQEALEILLSAAERDRELGRGPVRELMVKVFEIIGVRSEMSDEYRDRLRSLLY